MLLFKIGPFTFFLFMSLSLAGERLQPSRSNFEKCRNKMVVALCRALATVSFVI